MLRHIWSVVCAKAIIDQESNNVSLLEVLEEVGIELEVQDKGSPPEGGIPFPFEWITLWARPEFGKPTSGQVKDVVLSPSGKVIFEREYGIDLSAHERFRFRRGFRNLPVRESGQYQFCTQVRDEKKKVWQDVSSVPLTIALAMKKAKQS